MKLIDRQAEHRLGRAWPTGLRRSGWWAAAGRRRWREVGGVGRGLLAAVGIAVLLGAGGCFSQRSFPVQPMRVRRVVDLAASPHGERTVRQWLVAAQQQLDPLLPRADRGRSLLTDQLVTPDGRPIDVLARFRRDPARMHQLLANLDGLQNTAQASGDDTSNHGPVPPWPGFEDVWIPVADGLEYHARFGVAQRDGRPITSNCIFILPGLFGDLAVWRTRDIALALRAAGLHVLAIEPRGMGETNDRYSDVYCTFGVFESDELIQAALWAQRHPFVNRTGMIGFCWGANESLVTAWTVFRDDDDPIVRDRLRSLIAPARHARVFEAGFLAFSPVLRFEEIVDQCRTPTSILENPVINSLQGTVRNRTVQKQHREITGDLGKCIDFEFERTAGYYPGMVDDCYDYLRLLPYKGRPDGDKLAKVWAPVLIVQAANDPLTSAQNAADVIARFPNPNVAAIVLPGGGHVGFAPYARDYFYSLILSFFDPHDGAAAWTRPSAASQLAQSAAVRRE